MNNKLKILLAIVFLTSCNSKKEDKVVCQEPSFYCSHLEGCKAEYWCENPAQNNHNWSVYEYDCASDAKLAGYCQSQGFPCVDRKCAPEPTPCQNDSDCPTLGVCELERQKCVENCQCFHYFEGRNLPGCLDGSECETDIECGTGFVCDPILAQCVSAYCKSPELSCPRGTYCLMEPAITHFCQPWFTSDPVGRCTASSTCETAADCLDPLLPVCDGGGTCVP